MERNQQPNESVRTEKTPEERIEERTTRRGRLQIDRLEDRVAPSALWTD
jgi:hypothetical protein